MEDERMTLLGQIDILLRAESIWVVHLQKISTRARLEAVLHRLIA